MFIGLIGDKFFYHEGHDGHEEEGGSRLGIEVGVGIGVGYRALGIEFRYSLLRSSYCTRSRGGRGEAVCYPQMWRMGAEG